MNEEEKEIIKHLIERCNECKLNACITCDITWSEVQAIDKLYTLINTMQAEFERLENLEDDTDMLKVELKKKDMMIDLMIEEYEYNAGINVIKFCEDELRKDTCVQDCKACTKQYFERKIKEDK